MSLRHIVLLCMRKAQAYLACEAYKPLLSYPLKLTQGDIRENLAQLDAFEGRLDELTDHIRTCYRVDPGPWRTEQAVNLLRHACGSTQLCEEGHAPTKVAARNHGLYQLELLRLEGFFHLHKPLLGRTKRDKVVDALEAKYHEIARSCVAPRRLTGRQVLLHDLHVGDAWRPLELVGASAPLLMSAHVGLYAELDFSEKAALAKRGFSVAMEKLQTRQVEASRVYKALRAKQAERAQVDRNGVPTSVDACRYDAAWVFRFLELYEVSSRLVARWRLDVTRLEPRSCMWLNRRT